MTMLLRRIIRTRFNKVAKTFLCQMALGRNSVKVYLAGSWS